MALIKEKPFMLKDGSTVIIRNAEENDAEVLLFKVESILNDGT